MENGEDMNIALLILIGILIATLLAIATMK